MSVVNTFLKRVVLWTFSGVGEVVVEDWRMEKSYQFLSIFCMENNTSRCSSSVDQPLQHTHLLPLPSMKYPCTTMLSLFPPRGPDQLLQSRFSRVSCGVGGTFFHQSGPGW